MELRPGTKDRRGLDVTAHVLGGRDPPAPEETLASWVMHQMGQNMCKAQLSEWQGLGPLSLCEEVAHQGVDRCCLLSPSPIWFLASGR